MGQAAPRRQCAPPAAAAEPRQEGPQGHEQPPVEVMQQVNPQLWSELQLLAVRAQNLESSGQVAEAADMLGGALERLERQYGPDFSLVVLRQMLWDTLRASNRQEEALEQARRVHEAVGAQFGADSAEVQLVAVRLGISLAACGKLEEGMHHIYKATPVLQHNLGRMLGQVQRLAAGGGGQDEAAGATLPAEELEAVQESIDKVAAALGEGNFYGSLLTLQHAVNCGMQQGVVRGWEELEVILNSGFGSLVAAEAHVDGCSLVATALKEHDRVTELLKDDALLAKLIKAQNERLHQVAEQGVEHSLFK